YRTAHASGRGYFSLRSGWETLRALGLRLKEITEFGRGLTAAERHQASGRRDEDPTRSPSHGAFPSATKLSDRSPPRRKHARNAPVRPPYNRPGQAMG